MYGDGRTDGGTRVGSVLSLFNKLFRIKSQNKLNSLDEHLLRLWKKRFSLEFGVFIS